MFILHFWGTHLVARILRGMYRYGLRRSRTLSIPKFTNYRPNTSNTPLDPRQTGTKIITELLETNYFK